MALVVIALLLVGQGGLPEVWDVTTRLNVKWVAELGSESYGGPVVAGGTVFVGTNNEHLRDGAVEGDRGVVMAFRESDGTFLWQATHAKLETGAVNDWPLQGVCSTPTAHGDRLYYVSNRCELVSLDTEGFLDGENDGPLKNEATTGNRNADWVWRLDMRRELGVFPRNMSASTPLVVGDFLFTHTSNGTDDRGTVAAPEAPSFLAVKRHSGEIVWADRSPGEDLLEGQWSSPSYGVVDGQAQVIFPGGDGWLYAFEPQTGKQLWKFDGNARIKADGPVDRQRLNSFVAKAVIWEGRVYIGMGRDPEAGGSEGDLWVVDGTQRGDLTEGGVIWHRGGEEFGRTISTVAIADGLLYTADLDGFLYCLDARTGEHHWTYDAFASIWGSPLVADGKVYIGDDEGDVAILRAGTKKDVIAEINMGSSVLSTPAAQGGVLYIMTRERLYAIAVPGR